LKVILKRPIKAALLISADGEREFIYVIEDHGEDHLTVLLPWAPTAFAGFIKSLIANGLNCWMRI